MGLEFLRPYFLVLIPAGLAVTIGIFLRKGRRSLKGKTSLVLRSLAVLLICLSVVGTCMVFRSDKVELLILADRSESMLDEKSEQEKLVREIEKAMPDNYSLGVLSFGEDTVLEKKFSSASFGRFSEQNQNSATDYEQAVRFGAPLFGDDVTRRILILTDGRDNAGDVSRVTALMSARQIRADAWLYETKTTSDAQVSAVDVPKIVYENEKFDIHVEVESEVEKKVTLILYGGSTVLSKEEVNLQKGQNSFVFQDIADSTGLVGYRAVLQESGGVPENNQKSTVARVLGAPKLLMVEGAENEGEEFEKMLLSTGLSAERIQPQAFPKNMEGLQQYEAVLFVNVNAGELTAEQTANLDSFVKTLGRGFALVGGDNSYALGGYIGSGLEKILPVESDVRNKLDVPSLAMVMSIDHSGSMAEASMGLTRLDLAKESAQRAVEQLTPQDEVGVIAFSDTAKWIAPLQSAENAEEVKDLIGGLQLGGGTMMYSSIKESYDALTESDAAIKHLILMTDGEPADSGFEGLITEMRKDGITVSTVAMGRGANTGLMERLSEIGGGRFYHVDAADNIPAIFAKETQLSTQSYLQNRTFYPQFVMPSPLTADFKDGLPELTGFLATIAKPTATVALQSDNGLPILSSWQYGAGQVVAWTSDTAGIWSESYLDWDRGAAFFSGFLMAVLKEDTGQGYLSLTEQGGTGSIRFEVEGKDQAKTSATVIAPDGSEFEVPLVLTKPGEFAGDFQAAQEGAYAVKVEQTQDGQVTNSIQGGLVRGYSAEYDIREDPGHQALSQLLNAGGGAYLDDVASIFDAPLNAVSHQVELSLPLLLAGLILFFLDILARRLQWEAAAERVLERFSAKRRKRREQKQARVPVTAASHAGAAETPPVVSGAAAETLQAVPKAKRWAKEKPGEKKERSPEASGIGGELLTRRKSKKE